MPFSSYSNLKNYLIKLSKKYINNLTEPASALWFVASRCIFLLFIMSDQNIIYVSAHIVMKQKCIIIYYTFIVDVYAGHHLFYWE